MITLETADNALKSFYLDAVTDQLNMKANPFLAAIRQSTADVYGKDVKKVVRYGVNGGVGAGTEDGNLPTYGGSKYLCFTSELKNLFGTICISDKAIKASRNDEGAFVNLLNEEMESLVRSASFNLARMTFGDGSGTVGTVVGVAAGKIYLDTVLACFEGMKLDFYSETGTIIDTGRTITYVDRTGRYIQVSGDTVTATVLPADSFVTVQNSYGLEITGLAALFSDSEKLYGVERSVSSCMQPYKLSSVGSISENTIQKVIDYLDEVSGSKVNFIMCSWGVKRALADVLSQYKRNIDVMELAGGYLAMSFNGIPVVTDRFCPKGTMYLLNTDDFCLHQLGEWDWLRGEDGKILKQIAGKPMFEATLAKYANLLCTRPCGQAMLTGITEA